MGDEVHGVDKDRYFLVIFIFFWDKVFIFIIVFDCLNVYLLIFTNKVRFVDGLLV
jgi:hypothetical protein